MADTFMRTPFVSRDQPDADGVRAEVMVQTGVAMVASVDSNGKNAKVELMADNQKYTVKTWMTPGNKAFDILDDAYKNNKPINVRVEQRRLKRNRDTKEPILRSTPIRELLVDPTTHKQTNDLARRNAVKTLVGVAPVDGDMEFTGEEVTLPSEDPQEGSRAGVMSSNPVTSTPPAGYHSDGYEAQPWKGTNNDGTVNAGAYGVGAAAGFYFLALEQNAKIGDALAKTLASKLMVVCDYMQKKVYDGRQEYAERNAASHLRAREVVTEVIKSRLQVTDEVLGSSESLGEWLKKVLAASEEIYQWAYEDYGKSIANR